MATSGGIRLFDQDPDLLEVIPEEERPLALRSTVVSAMRLSLGSWDRATAGRPRWGLLILNGVVVAEIGVAGSTAAELLGTGDVVLGANPLTEPIVPMERGWTVIEPGTVAFLDERAEAALRRWPQLAGCLLDRVQRRADRLAMAQAISHLTRVDARVLMMLWLLADRWGRVANQALVIPIRLTHRTLARLVGARRPSVTTAVSQLGERGLISRRDDGSWLVHGAPPEELARVGIEPLPAHPAPHRDAANERSAAGRINPVLDIRRRVSAELPRHAAAYEEPRDRTREVAERSRVTSETSRTLREARLEERKS
jgi:CRP-like cAMP-binding protein